MRQTIDKRKNLLGLTLFVVLLTGGGAAPGIWTDTVLQVAVMAVSVYCLATAPEEARSVPPLVNRLMLLILLVSAYQLVPLPSALVNMLRPETVAAPSSSSIGFLTLDLDRTLSCLITVGTLLLFFRAVLELSTAQTANLLPFLLAGAACNGLIALIQYSVTEKVELEGVLPYTIRAGIFANQNHFATLMFVTIPFLIFWGIFKERLLMSVVGLLALLLVLFAAGSRAGILIGLVISAASFPILRVKSPRFVLAGFACILILAVFLVGAWSQFELQPLDAQIGRATFARTTIDGIRDNWLTGVGFGVFPGAYALYERSEDIFGAYVNHAHNEYLEIVFEGGLPAVIALLAFFAALATRLPFVLRTPLKRAAFLSMFFIMVHSAVDYPLRTMAIALVFAFLLAVIFQGEDEGTSRSRREGRRVSIHTPPAASDADAADILVLEPHDVTRV